MSQILLPWVLGREERERLTVTENNNGEERVGKRRRKIKEKGSEEIRKTNKREGVRRKERGNRIFHIAGVISK